MATGRLPDPNTAPVTAKGDLYTYSTVPAKLAVGNNGETLVADSSATTGLRWQGNYAAGKNIVINGGMDIWQRGTSSSSLGNYFTADRWYQGAWSGTGTWARESTVVPAGSQYSAKFTASATAQPYFIQAIETANAVQLAGKTVTLSALVAASTSTGFSLTLSHSSNVDNALTGSWTDITATSGGTATATSTTFVTLSGVYSIPSTAKSLRLVVQTTSTIANTVVVYIGQVQLEEGSVRTSFSRAGGTLAGEFQACRRYYQKFGGGNNYEFIGQGFAGSTTSLSLPIQLDTPMRVVPTSVDFSTLAWWVGGAVTTITAAALQANSNSAYKPIIQFTTTGLTSLATYGVLTNNSTSGYVALNAEL